MKANVYHNTTNLKGSELKTHQKKATSQEVQVLKIFKEHKTLTASECWVLYGRILSPITSIRRAISNLTTLNVLERTIITKKGMYGSPEHYYKLKTNK